MASRTQCARIAFKHFPIAADHQCWIQFVDAIYRIVNDGVYTVYTEESSDCSINSHLPRCFHWKLFQSSFKPIRLHWVLLGRNSFFVRNEVHNKIEFVLCFKKRADYWTVFSEHSPKHFPQCLGTSLNFSNKNIFEEDFSYLPALGSSKNGIPKLSKANHLLCTSIVFRMPSDILAKCRVKFAIASKSMTSNRFNYLDGIECWNFKLIWKSSANPLIKLWTFDFRSLLAALSVTICNDLLAIVDLSAESRFRMSRVLPGRQYLTSRRLKLGARQNADLQSMLYELVGTVRFTQFWSESDRWSD